MPKKRTVKDMTPEEKSAYDNVNVQVLVDLVSPHQYLYSNKDPKHLDNDLKDRIWSQINESLNIPKDIAYNKFKNLKDAYERKKKNVRESTLSGAASSKASRARKEDPNMALMSFLDDPFKTRPSVGNMNEYNEDGSQIMATDPRETDNINLNMFNSPEIVNGSQNVNSPQEDLSVVCRSINDNVYVGMAAELHGDIDDSTNQLEVAKSRKKLSRCEQLKETAIELEKIKADALSKALNFDSNSDRHFLLSLLPFMTKFSDLDSLSVRSQIIQVIVDQLKELAEKQRIFDLLHPDHSYSRSIINTIDNIDTVNDSPPNRDNRFRAIENVQNKRDDFLEHITNDDSMDFS